MKLWLAGLLVVGAALREDPVTVQAQKFPFTLHRSHLLLVRGTIGSLRNLVLLLDTGSGRTIVDNTVASSLGLRGEPTVLASFGARVPAEELVIPTLEIGDYRTASEHVVATDLSTTAASLELTRLDGIIGIDLLRRTSFAVDYAHRLFLLGPPVRLPHRVPFVSHPIFFVVAARVNGTSVNLIVDTGASHIALVGPRPDLSTGTGNPVQPSHLGGAALVRPVILQKVAIGSWSTRGVTALVTEESAGRTEGTDGILTLSALASDFVQFDVESQELGWRF